MTDHQQRITNDPPAQTPRHPLDRAERPALFSEQIIAFARALPVDALTRPLICPVVRAGTSVGTRYVEADDSLTCKQRHDKMSRCRKESRETERWLRINAQAHPERRAASRRRWAEAHELDLIFPTMVRRLVDGRGGS
ncbi:MAG: four helix bundle protein [Alphaproteobacteria bacterium]|jgi:four helix bundle protein|nr:four helix bundle protein [Alphaproteobacteria bacterium]